MSKNLKGILYRPLVRLGVKTVMHLFPEYFGSEPLKPTDRFIECNFIMSNLPKPPAKILDVGCAGSFLPLQLAGFGYDTYGLDLREYAIINKIKFDNFHFLKENIKSTNFPDNYFDVVTAVSTVGHIGLSGRYGEREGISDDIIAVAQMSRVVKPQGIILLTLPFGQAKIIRPYMRVYDKDGVNALIGTLKIAKAEYYMQDDGDDWFQCSQEEAGKVDAKSDRYPLCLLKLIKAL